MKWVHRMTSVVRIIQCFQSVASMPALLCCAASGFWSNTEVASGPDRQTDRQSNLILEPCSMHMSLVIRNQILQRPPVVCRESKVCDKIPRLPPSVLGWKRVPNDQCGVVSTALSVHRWQRHFAQIWRPHYVPTSGTSKLLWMFRKCICNIYESVELII
jgi:hypothetical protein